MLRKLPVFESEVKLKCVEFEPVVGLGRELKFEPKFEDGSKFADPTIEFRLAWLRFEFDPVYGFEPKSELKFGKLRSELKFELKFGSKFALKSVLNVRSKFESAEHSSNKRMK